MHKEGIALLEHCEKEAKQYADGKMQEREPVEWSDAEEEFGIEDDIPLPDSKRILRPSRLWQAKHCVMETTESEWHLQQKVETSRRRAQT